MELKTVTDALRQSQRRFLLVPQRLQNRRFGTQDSMKNLGGRDFRNRETDDFDRRMVRR